MNILKKQILNNSHTKLLVHPVGADSSTTFLDNSSNPKTITVAGNACIKTQNLKHPYAKSAIFFNGSSYLSSANSSDFNFSVNNFTVEGWFLCTSPSTATKTLIGLVNTTGYGYAISIDNGVANKITVAISSNGSSWDIVPNVVVGEYETHKWMHIALVRCGSSFYFFINGTLVYTTVSTASVYFASNILTIGGYYALSLLYPFTGYIADWRLSDVARYTDNFIVPSAYLSSDAHTKLLIRGDEYQDYLATEHTGKSLTLGSTLSLNSFQKHPYASIAGYFDGTGDYLSTPYTSDFTLASGDDFTIDFWMYPLSNSLGYIFNTALQPLNYTAIAIQFSTVLSFTIGNSAGSSSFTFSSASGVISLNNWHYIGIKRSSGTTTLWSDGVQIATSSTLYSSTGNGNVYISNQNINFFQGYLADFRFSKGIARDLSVVPTSPLTSDSYTKLLLPMSTSGTTFTDTTGKSITTYGDAKQITCQPGNIDKTLYFDGTSTGIITIPTSSDFDFGSNDFTIEWWQFLSASPSNGAVFSHYGGTSLRGFYFGYQGRYYGLSSTGTTWDIAYQRAMGSNITNQWVHRAVTRNGTSIKVFENGILKDTLTTSAIISFPAATMFEIMRYNGIALSGNLAWFHVVNGTALYTSSFIAPQNPVVNLNTKLLVYPGKSSTFFKDSSSSWNPKIITSSGSTKTYSLPANKSSSYFDGTGDYLTIPTGSNNFLFADKDLTIHCWVNLSSHNWCIFHTTGTNGYAIYGTSTQTYIDANGTTNNSTTNISLTDSLWHHVAFVRKNNVGSFYKDGSLLFTFTCTANNSTEGNIYVGAYAAGSYETLGYIKDFTVVKGQALWTKNFNPPTKGI